MPATASTHDDPHDLNCVRLGGRGRRTLRMGPKNHRGGGERACNPCCDRGRVHRLPLRAQARPRACRGGSSRQAHLCGNPRTSRASSTSLPGHRPLRGRSARAAAGCDAIVNFAAETTSTGRSSGWEEFVHVLGYDARLLEWARVHDACYAAEARLMRSMGDFAAVAVLGLQRGQGRRRPAGARARPPHLWCPRLDHARSEHVRPVPVSREARAPLRHERLRRRAAAGVLGDAEGAGMATCCIRPLVLHEGSPGPRSRTSAVRITRASRNLPTASSSWSRDPSLIRHVEDRRVTTGATRSTTQSCGHGWSPQHSFGEGGLPATVDWYR